MYDFDKQLKAYHKRLKYNRELARRRAEIRERQDLHKARTAFRIMNRKLKPVALAA